MIRIIANTILVLLLVPVLLLGQPRIKDVTDVEGIASLPLIGYGIVVGLDGSGDSRSALFTNQAVLNMLDRFGITLESDRVRVRNVAGVMVTAEMPPFAKINQRVDVTISSIGDCRSLSGGTLLLSPLIGPDGEIYGIAQGPVSVGGFAVESEGVSVRTNATAVARIPSGLLIERELGYEIEGIETFRYALHQGDFTTARRIAETINDAFGEGTARAVDPVSIEVTVIPNYPGGAMAMISDTEQLNVEPDVEARVVVNERTGTVVIGSDVQLASVAVSHGSISISIVSTPMVSQPGAFSQGRTVQTQASQIQVQQEGTGVVVIEQSTSVGDVAGALNNLGVSPRDIIAIFQALKEAGALQADLVII